MGLDKASYLTVAKLTAILRLANSLDRSHKQKMKGVKAVLQENELILKVDTQEDITLEKGFFQTSTEFFKEVYSITPVSGRKRNFKGGSRAKWKSILKIRNIIPTGN